VCNETGLCGVVVEGTWTVVRHRFINLSFDSPVWFETMMSAAADQSPEATATLPRVAVPSRPSTLCRGSSVVALRKG
jgi:hypothetical protein